MIYRLHRQQVVPAGLGEVWDYFATPKNLDELTPSDMRFQIVSGGEKPMYQGQLIEYRVQILPRVVSPWLTEIAHLKEKACFVDEQRLGPYKFWYHEHHFKPIHGGTRISDRVTYQMPFGSLGDFIHTLWVGPRLKSIFDYRWNKIQALFDA